VATSFAVPPGTVLAPTEPAEAPPVFGSQYLEPTAASPA
jgi:hypothetical protein